MDHHHTLTNTREPPATSSSTAAVVPSSIAASSDPSLLLSPLQAKRRINSPTTVHNEGEQQQLSNNNPAVIVQPQRRPTRSPHRRTTSLMMSQILADTQAHIDAQRDRLLPISPVTAAATSSSSGGPMRIRHRAVHRRQCSLGAPSNSAMQRDSPASIARHISDASDLSILQAQGKIFRSTLPSATATPASTPAAIPSPNGVMVMPGGEMSTVIPAFNMSTTLPITINTHTNSNTAPAASSSHFKKSPRLSPRSSPRSSPTHRRAGSHTRSSSGGGSGIDMIGGTSVVIATGEIVDHHAASSYSHTAAASASAIVPPVSSLSTSSATTSSSSSSFSNELPDWLYEYIEVFRVFLIDLTAFEVWLRNMMRRMSAHMINVGEGNVSDSASSPSQSPSSSSTLFTPLLPEASNLLLVLSFARAFLEKRRLPHTRTWLCNGSGDSHSHANRDLHVNTAGNAMLERRGSTPGSAAEAFPTTPGIRIELLDYPSPTSATSAPSSSLLPPPRTFTLSELNDWRTTLSLELVIASWSDSEWHAGEVTFEGAALVVRNRMLDVSERLANIYASMEEVRKEQRLMTAQQTQVDDSTTAATTSSSTSTTPTSTLSEQLSHISDSLLYVQADFSGLFHCCQLIDKYQSSNGGASSTSSSAEKKSSLKANLEKEVELPISTDAAAIESSACASASASVSVSVSSSPPPSSSPTTINTKLPTSEAMASSTYIVLESDEEDPACGEGEESRKGSTQQTTKKAPVLTAASSTVSDPVRSSSDIQQLSTSPSPSIESSLSMTNTNHHAVSLRLASLALLPDMNSSQNHRKNSSSNNHQQQHQYQPQQSNKPSNPTIDRMPDQYTMMTIDHDSIILHSDDGLFSSPDQQKENMRLRPTSSLAHHKDMNSGNMNGSDEQQQQQMRMNSSNPVRSSTSTTSSSQKSNNTAPVDSPTRRSWYSRLLCGCNAPTEPMQQQSVAPNSSTSSTRFHPQSTTVGGYSSRYLDSQLPPQTPHTHSGGNHGGALSVVSSPHAANATIDHAMPPPHHQMIA